MTHTMERKRKKPKKNPSNPWPATLAALRTKLDLSQQQAADRVKAPVGTWRGWEYGRRVPSAMIAELLRLSFPEFFGKKT